MCCYGSEIKCNLQNNKVTSRIGSRCRRLSGEFQASFTLATVSSSFCGMSRRSKARWDIQSCSQCLVLFTLSGWRGGFPAPSPFDLGLGPLHALPPTFPALITGG